MSAQSHLMIMAVHDVYLLYLSSQGKIYRTNKNPTDGYNSVLKQTYYWSWSGIFHQSFCQKRQIHQTETVCQRSRVGMVL